MKLVLIAIVVLVLLGGGAAAYFLVFNAEEPVAEGEEGEHGDGHGDGHGNEGEGMQSDDPVFVEFNPILLPIINDDDSVEQVVSLLVTLEVAGTSGADQVIAMAPRLNDAYLRALYGRLRMSDVAENGVIDLRRIKSRLIEESNRVLGERVVFDVLIQMVSQRML